MGVTCIFILVFFKFFHLVWKPWRFIAPFGALFICIIGIASVYIGQVSHFLGDSQGLTSRLLFKFDYKLITVFRSIPLIGEASPLLVTFLLGYLGGLLDSGTSIIAIPCSLVSTPCSPPLSLYSLSISWSLRVLPGEQYCQVSILFEPDGICSVVVY